MSYIKNPILPGFNPDPSIIRVGDDYYIATSTFEWYPGVQIHHSKDLINWKLVARPLNRLSQLNMRGNPDSHGIWAPCLTYHNGVFYLIYTDVKSIKGNYMDSYNYLVTTTDICGDWSDPVFLCSTGFDPSLFHDDNGTKWFVIAACNNSIDETWFGGILLQQYNEAEKRLVGPVYKIFEGTELGCTEGPHLYKKHGYYYLLTAEGGTGLNHAVTMARSKKLTGPYEVDPQNPVLTSKLDPQNPLQKAGHADLVETDDGQIYMVHLCARPLGRTGRCILGRETAIQKVKWTEDNWLRLEDGCNKPSFEVPSPGISLHPWEDEPVREDFNTDKLNIHFQTLRSPADESWLTLKERQGFLRLYGRGSLCSLFDQSLVARRQQAFCYTAGTVVEFEPENFKHMAGLVCYYNTENYYYLRITHDKTIGKCIGIVACNNYNISYPVKKELDLNGWDKCFMKVIVEYDMLQFYYSKDGVNWNSIGPILDSSSLSDENCKVAWGFTGAFVGICCQDLTGHGKHADFNYFDYEESQVDK